ncbi:MAG: FGGY-family carbohydrate kinase, partial [Granulosicoccus sp.]
MSEELVIGLDSSTQSTKAIAWNRQGRAIAEGRADIPMANPQLDYYEQQSQHWWQAAIDAIAQCTAQIESSCVKGFAISNQRETLAFLDEDDQDTHPAILWLDERSREQVKTFAASFGSDRIHAITGRRPDTTSCLYTFAWMREQQPDIYRRTAKFVDVQSYLVRQMCGGDYRTGWISADPMGIIDMQRHQWSKELLSALDLDESRLSTIHPPGTQLGTLMDDVAIRLKLPAQTPVFA